MNNMYIYLIYILLPFIISLSFTAKNPCMYADNDVILPNIKAGGLKFDDILLYDNQITERRNAETLLKNLNFYSNSFTIKSITIKNKNLFQTISPIEHNTYESFLFLSQSSLPLQSDNYSEESKEEYLGFTFFQTKKSETIKNSILSIYLIEKQLFFLRIHQNKIDNN